MSYGNPFEKTSFKAVISALNISRVNPRWQGRWIVADDWVKIIQLTTGTAFSSVTEKVLNNAIGRSKSLKFGFEDFDANAIGFLRRSYSPEKNKIWCYFASVPGTKVDRPLDGTAWYKEIQPIDFSPAANTRFRLRTMIASMPDFENEETRLQYVGRKLGIVVDRSPKYHPEVAGEDIEYFWGCASITLLM